MKIVYDKYVNHYNDEYANMHHISLFYKEAEYKSEIAFLMFKLFSYNDPNHPIIVSDDTTKEERELPFHNKDGEVETFKQDHKITRTMEIDLDNLIMTIYKILDFIPHNVYKTTYTGVYISRTKDGHFPEEYDWDEEDKNMEEYYVCPNCGSESIHSYHSYCHDCGKMIIWTKEK